MVVYWYGGIILWGNSGMVVVWYGGMAVYWYGSPSDNALIVAKLDQLELNRVCNAINDIDIDNK